MQEGKMPKKSTIDINQRNHCLPNQKSLQLQIETWLKKVSKLRNRIKNLIRKNDVFIDDNISQGCEVESDDDQNCIAFANAFSNSL